MNRLLFAVVFATLSVIPVYAHHSFARYYFENETISIAGQIIEFEYRSPHAWVHLMAPDKNGQMQRFSAEWSNTNRLARSQVLKDTLKPGDHVIISGSPGRNPGEYKLHLKGIHRPADGWKFGRVQEPR
jgi:hypothetical protein